MKRSLILIAVLSAILLCGSNVNAQVTVEFVNPASDPPGLNPFVETLPPETIFSADIRLNSSVGNLRGVNLAITTDPPGVISVNTITMPSSMGVSDYDIYKTDNITTNRVAWFKSGGHTNDFVVASVSFTAIGSQSVSDVRVIINVLQIIGVADLTPLLYTAVIPNVDLELLDGPTTTTTTTSILPNVTPTPFNSNETRALYNVVGGCSINTPRNDKTGGILIVLLFTCALAVLFMRNKKAKGLFVLLLFIVAMTLSSPAFSATYYVDNNDASCTTEYSGDAADPFCNLSDVLSTLLIPGDIIEVLSGYDQNEASTLLFDRTINGQGVIGIPITLRGEGAGPPTATIKNSGSFALIGVQRDTNYWTIENLNIQNGGYWTPTGGEPATAASIGADGAGVGLVIRDNVFSGTLPSGEFNDVIRINSDQSYFSNFSTGHLIENNTFQNYSATSAFAFISVQFSSYSVIRGNHITHTTSATSPWRHIAIEGGSRNIIERNFSAGYFADTNEAANISVESQGGSVVRNNILYMQAAQNVSATDLRGMTNIRILRGGSNRIHNNSGYIDIDGGADDRRIAGIYSGTTSSTSYVTNNIFSGGEYCAAGIYLFDYSSQNAGFNVDYNDCYGWTDADHMPQYVYVADDDLYYACYMGWYYDYPTPDGSGSADQTECEAVDTAGTYNTYNNTDGVFPYTQTGGNKYAAPYYAVAGGSDAATLTWSTATNCSDLDGDSAACDGNAGAYSGVTPYGNTSTFSFCGDVYPNTGPDKAFDMRDVVYLYDNLANTTLATQVAQYLVTLNPSENNATTGNTDPLPGNCF